MPSQYRLRNESSAASVAHPSAAPLFQFVVLCDVEFPVANESDYTDGDKYRAYEEPGPINAPVRVHKLEAIIQDDCAYPRKDDRAKQALTWRWADACRQMGLMPTCSFDGHAWSEPGLGLRLVGCLYVRSASSMDDRQKLDVLTLALRAADCVIAHHVIIPLRVKGEHSKAIAYISALRDFAHWADACTAYPRSCTLPGALTAASG